MRPEIPKLLEDIRDAAAFVLEVLSGKTLEDYRSERILRQAVERNFEIIGEATRRLALADPGIAEQLGSYPEIISFRNVLIHGYDVVIDDVVWQVAQDDLPDLLERIGKLAGSDLS